MIANHINSHGHCLLFSKPEGMDPGLFYAAPHCPHEAVVVAVSTVAFFSTLAAAPVASAVVVSTTVFCAFAASHQTHPTGLADLPGRGD